MQLTYVCIWPSETQLLLFNCAALRFTGLLLAQIKRPQWVCGFEGSTGLF